MTFFDSLVMTGIAAGLGLFTAVQLPSPSVPVKVVRSPFVPAAECSGCEATQLNDGVFTNGVQTGSAPGFTLSGVLLTSSGSCVEKWSQSQGQWLCVGEDTCDFAGTWAASYSGNYHSGNPFRTLTGLSGGGVSWIAACDGTTTYGGTHFYTGHTQGAGTWLGTIHFGGVCAICHF
jgi:hypothetical protein